MEKEEIIKSFNSVIEYSQGYPKVDSEQLITECLEKKRYFIEQFGGLIFEVPQQVSFELDVASKSERVNKLCSKIESEGYYELAKFLFLQADSFYSNRVCESYTTENGDIITTGMKLTRAFKYFVDSKTELRRLQDLASAYIQEDKITGTLCFSVHPLDFLSSSENNNNWRSCHALDGDYRSGNLSYMVDECTFMVYLKSDEDVILPDFPSDVPWNNKKWRTLMFINDTRDMMFAGRQYPFSSPNGLTLVKNLITEYFPEMGKWTDWSGEMIRTFNTPTNNVSLHSPYIGVGNKLISMRTLIKDGSHLHYNDLLLSTCYSPVYSYKLTKRYHSYFNEPVESIVTSNSGRFNIGGQVKCLCCGKGDIVASEFMSCNSCELKYGTTNNDTISTCDCCENRFFTDDGVFVESPGELICEDCYRRYAAMCACCENVYYTDDMSYDEITGNYLCRYCR